MTEKTSEISFHRFPCGDNNQHLIDVWRSAIHEAVGKTIEIELKEAYICSRHFTSDNFALSDGKTVLHSSAVPSVFATTGDTDVESDDKDKKPAMPPVHGNNFASTSTINFMTISRNYPRTTSTCTETTKTSTTSASESLQNASDVNMNDGVVQKITKKMQATKRRMLMQQRKLKRMSNLVRRMRSDNLLTDEYLAQLTVCLESLVKSKKIEINFDFCLCSFLCRKRCQRQSSWCRRSSAPQSKPNDINRIALIKWTVIDYYLLFIRRN